MKLHRIIIGTGNQSKKERYGKLLAPFAEGILGPSDVGITEKPREYGSSAEENAVIKARFYASRAKLPAFAEDEALFVDFLPADQQPGVHVRRINGKDEADDATLLRYWEAQIANVPEAQRIGRWHFAYCLATPNGETRVVALDHPIVFFSPSSRVRLPGYPMSSLEGPVKFSKPHSELTKDERAILDAEVAQLLQPKLRELFEESK